MLGLAWTCDWLGCSARMVQAYDADGWGGFGADSGWVDGRWDLGDSGWTTDDDGKVWCAVHALLHQMEGAAALELRPPKGLPATTIQDVHALAERHPGDRKLRIAVPSRAGQRVLTLGTTVAPSQELLAALLEYGPVVVVAHEA